jgi:hypothetical protein
MTMDHLITVGIVLIAAIFLASRLRKKGGGCCGCGGCSGEIQPRPSGHCQDRKP